MNGNESEKETKNMFNNPLDSKKDDKMEIKLCNPYFKGIQSIKRIFQIDNKKKKKKYKKIIEYCEFKEENIYIKSQFKKEMEKIFKDFEENKEINLGEASNLLFKGEIMDILSEKMKYESLSVPKQSQNSDFDEENILEDIFELEHQIDDYSKTIQTLKTKAFLCIKQFEGFFVNDEEHPESSCNKDPFKYLNENEYSVSFNYMKKETIKKIYKTYLINFYFYADDCINYLNEIKNKYRDNELIAILSKNDEKIKLLDVLNPRIIYQQQNDLKEGWNKLKQEKVFLKDNALLDKKIKEYVMTNDITQFLKDFNDIEKIKGEIINLSKSEPQKMVVLAYLFKKGIPLNIPEGLKKIK